MADEQAAEVPEVKAEGNEITVEVAPYGERIGKPELSDEEVEKLDEAPPEDEVTKYAKDAQKRIKSLHIANQEWRRRVVQSNKDVATATNLANQLYQENQSLKASTARSEQALIDQALQRAEAQLMQAKGRYRVARQQQNAEEELAAQEDIARFVAESDRLRLLRPASPVKDGEPGGGVQAAPAAPVEGPTGPPRGQQPAPVSEATKRWMGSNTWFGRAGEEKMTGFALGVHQALEKQGITEFNNPKEYWGTIDREMRETFPQRFAEANGKEARPEGGSRPVAVAGATRTSNSTPQRGPRHVVLTESQVRIAKSLGLTNEQYAVELVKEEQQREHVS